MQYERAVPQELESAVLAAMGWASLTDVPMGENDLT
ncbi:pyocin S6 family toxin immunity protein [Pseudomonas sp. RTC3]|nr:pyocin S6 family toxin immunity protein [Pseudomonas sp. MH9.2]MEB0062163.1 pyocin S6 family toxin immunity protein [Pseudomonas sp. RTC3]WPX71435.1 pyocin S6 family toxin immunity protein [Pseudomonas sp. MH9.2]